MSQEYSIEIKHKIKRCVEPGCEKSARDKTNKCVAHGGGKRCVEPGCEKGARSKTDKCVAHGVGKNRRKQRIC